MKNYKVWIEIEEFDDVTEEGETVDAPGASIATFANYGEAYDFVARLNETAEMLAALEGARDGYPDDDQ